MNIELINKLWKGTKVVNKCFLWTSVNARGYGYIQIKYKGYRVHRLALCIYHKLNYEDDSWTANHICRNNNCWNPLHLYKGTQAENITDQVKLGTHANSRVGQCPKGHLYSKENTRVYKGKRFCKLCQQLVNRGDKDDYRTRFR